jgi:hypothetical protein
VTGPTGSTGATGSGAPTFAQDQGAPSGSTGAGGY